MWNKTSNGENVTVYAAYERTYDFRQEDWPSKSLVDVLAQETFISIPRHYSVKLLLTIELRSNSLSKFLIKILNKKFSLLILNKKFSFESYQTEENHFFFNRFRFKY